MRDVARCAVFSMQERMDPSSELLWSARAAFARARLTARLSRYTRNAVKSGLSDTRRPIRTARLRASERGANHAAIVYRVRVQPVPQAVGEHVEAQHRQHDREPREDHHPRRLQHEAPPVGEHQAKRRRGRTHTHAQERQRGLDQDADRHQHGGLDEHRRGRVRHDVGQHQPRDAGAERTRAVDVDFDLRGQHRGAHHAGDDRRVDDRQRHRDQDRAGAEHAHERDRQQDGGEGHQHVEGAHDQLVGQALGVAGHETERAADQQGEQGGGDRHAKRDAIGVDDAAQHAAAQIVHPERLRGRRTAQRQVLGDLGRAAEGEQRRAERGHGQRDDDHQAGERDPAARHRRRTRGSITP